jgi:hypothetical protein
MDMDTFIPSSNTHPMLCHTGCILSILQHLSGEADVARAAATTRPWSQAACTNLIWCKLHISKWGEPGTWVSCDHACLLLTWNA